LRSGVGGNRPGARHRGPDRGLTYAALAYDSRMRQTAVVSALLLAALPACNRDLSVPSREGPALSGISPTHAFAGEEMTIFGVPFDADPTANLVQFAGATSRGERFNSDGSLVVKVPPDAGTGFITVSTPLGSSAPVGPFSYDGLGQLRLNSITHEIPLLHKPYKVIASGGDTFISSDLVVSLVRYSDDVVVSRYERSTVGLPWANGGAGAVVWYQDQDDPASQLVRLDIGSPAHAPVTVADSPNGAQIAVMRAFSTTPDRIAMFRHGEGTAPTTPATLTVYDAVTFAQTFSGSYPAEFVRAHGCDDAGNAGTSARLVCVCHPSSSDSDPAELALTVLAASPTVTFYPSSSWDGTLIHHQKFSLEQDDPMCVALGTGGHRVAAVGLEDGRLLLADLDAGTFSYADTGSRTVAQSLTCPGPASGPTFQSMVLVAKTDDGLLTAVDIVTNKVRWAVPIPRAARASVDGTVVHVAGDSDNVVSLLDLTTGQLLARRSFDPQPGKLWKRSGPDEPDGTFSSGVQGGAWSGTGVLGVPVVVASIEFPRGVLEVPVELTGGQNRVFPWYVRDDVGIGVTPGISPDLYLTLEETGLHVELGDYNDHTDPYTQSTGGFVDVGHDVQLGVDGPRDLHLGTWDGFVTVHYDGSGTVMSPLPESSFVSMGVLPDPSPSGTDHRILAAVNQWNAPWYGVLEWTLSDAHAGNDATSTWEAPGPVDGAAVLQGTLWGFYWDGTTDHAVELTRDLDDLRDIPMNDFINQIVTVSPNGRTFVSWENQPFSENTSIVIWSYDPDASFPRAATIPIDGQVAGAVFDPTGESLYVLMRNPGRIVVLD